MRFSTLEHRAVRCGMTLVELLVVIGILLLLMVTVAPVLTPTPAQQGREAAGTVISMINRAQKRAIDQNADAGLWLEPLTTSTSGTLIKQNVPVKTAFIQVDGIPLAMACLDMFACEPQNAYNGDDPDTARVFLYPVNSSAYNFVPGFPDNTRLALFEQQSCGLIRIACAQSSVITVDQYPYYFRLLSTSEQNSLSPAYFPKPYRPCNLGPPPGGQLPASDRQFQDPNDPKSYYYAVPRSASAELVAAMVWSEDGNTPATSNEPFSPAYDHNHPVLPVSGHGVPFAISRPNARTATPPLTIPAGYAVDVAWSSYGTTLLHNLADASRLGNGSQMQLIDNFLANQPVQVMFDLNGGLKHLVFRKFVAGFGSGAVIDATLKLNTDLYLLIGRAERAGLPYVANPTEANPGANWQYPDSRWIRIDQGTGKTLIADPYLGAVNVFDSQAYARGDVAALRN